MPAKKSLKKASTQKTVEEKIPSSVLAPKTEMPKLPKKSLSTGTKVMIGVGISCCVIILGVILVITGLAIFGSQKVLELQKTTQEAQQLLEEDEYKNWQSYQNSRYNFEVKIPPEFIKTESANGDGASFTLSDPPVSINAFGINSQSQDLKDYLNIEKNNLSQAVGEVYEIEAQETNLDGENARQRIWQYESIADGSLTYKVITASVKGNTIYNIEMIVSPSEYDNYKNTLEKTIESFIFL